MVRAFLFIYYFITFLSLLLGDGQLSRSGFCYHAISVIQDDLCLYFLEAGDSLSEEISDGPDTLRLNGCHRIVAFRSNPTEVLLTRDKDEDSDISLMIDSPSKRQTRQTSTTPSSLPPDFLAKAFPPLLKAAFRNSTKSILLDDFSLTQSQLLLRYERQIAIDGEKRNSELEARAAKAEQDRDAAIARANSSLSREKELRDELKDEKGVEKDLENKLAKKIEVIEDLKEKLRKEKLALEKEKKKAPNPRKRKDRSESSDIETELRPKKISKKETEATNSDGGSLVESTTRKVLQGGSGLASAKLEFVFFDKK